MAVETIFQRADLSAPALINPTDTTEKIKDFPKICVSTFSDNIIRKFASMEHVEQIAELYTANGAMPVYKIRYKNTEIAFFQSRVGRLPVSSALRKLWQWGRKNIWRWHLSAE